jgi:hypothetical protein
LSFFEHTCYLHCAVPRITTTDGKVRTVDVPWARPGSGFTLLFEALALALIEREMPVNRVAEILKVNPQRIWTIFNHPLHAIYRCLWAKYPQDFHHLLMITLKRR